MAVLDEVPTEPVPVVNDARGRVAELHAIREQAPAWAQ